MSNRYRAGTGWVRATLIVLVPLLVVLAPQAAGLQGALLLPVQYARLELPQRGPAVVKVHLPPATYTVSPASLGYFAPSGEFVYTADVARGLVYGQASPDAPAYVVEIAAPPQAEEFIADYLDRIRNLTREVNTRRNRLRQARLEFEACRSDRRTNELMQEFWSLIDQGSFGAEYERWLQQAADAEPGGGKRLEQLLKEQAGLRESLKELYYAAYEARVELLLAQFNLQLALARLPKRSGPQLLPQPGAQTIAGNMLAETGKLRGVWEERQRQLALVPDAADGGGLATASFFPMPGDILPRDNPAVAAPAPRIAAPPQATALQTAAAAARQRVCQAESDGLGRALRALTQAESSIALQAGRQQDSLPRYELAAAAFSPPMLDLGDAGQVEQLALDVPLASWLLLKLARLFEGGRGAPGPAVIEEQFSALRPRGAEVACGVFVVDRYLRTATHQGQPQSVAEAHKGLEQRLRAICLDPDSYGAAALDLGYLRFMDWYALQASAVE